MGFVLEYLDDEERAKNGFATEIDYLALKKQGIFIFPIKKWAVDHTRNAAIVCSIGNMARAQIELYWKNYVILAVGDALLHQRPPEGNEMGSRDRQDVHFKIKELIIPEDLKEEANDVKELLVEGLEVYCFGHKDLNGKGSTTFLPTMDLRFGKAPRSAFKISSYSQYLTQN